MLNENILDDAKNKLIKTYDPLAIYLFGSYAWGNPSKDSDLDLLILVDHAEKERGRRAVAGHLALFNLIIPKDLVVYTKKEFENLSTDRTTLCYKIKNEGKLIYAKS